MNVKVALASSAPARGSIELKVSPGGLPKDNGIIIQPGFMGAYKAGGIDKELTKWGRCTTLLHELTHSVLNTVDVRKYGKNDFQCVSPEKDVEKAVTTTKECKELAACELSKSKVRLLPMSWVNAENWTRAIVSCDSGLSSKSERRILK